jgi:endonuclease/exonuclease/phosphatase family metal-dependent hydrolase
MSRFPPSLLWALLLGALAAGLAGCLAAPERGGAAAGQDYLFCFWNAENFFDDQDDNERREPDRDFDKWFATDRAAFRQKLQNLTTVLAEMNDGQGPDILAVAEVESEHAADLLADSLSKAVKGAPRYRNVLFRDPHGGRHIATAIITRLPVLGDRTQLHGRRQRILEGHIEVNGADLVVLATHWTSRVSDTEGEGREHYADQIYGRFLAMYKANPRVDMLICGDFNDNPDSESVAQNLHATGDIDKVRAGGDPPALLDLFANLWAKNKDKDKKERVGTHFYRGQAYIFDHLVVSPGLLDDRGWKCEVGTAHIWNKHKFVDKLGRPVRFGTERDKVPLDERGASDHLPVTVRLRVVEGR